MCYLTAVYPWSLVCVILTQFVLNVVDRLSPTDRQQAKVICILCMLKVCYRYVTGVWIGIEGHIAWSIFDTQYLNANKPKKGIP